MTPPAANAAAIFDANRVQGVIDLRVSADAGRTRRAQVRESGALRVRFPNAPGGDTEAVIINTAGGVAGGDVCDFAFAVDPSAALTVTTAAAEKVYRALAAPARISVRLEVAEGGRLCWLPQETILFDAARLTRRFEVDVAAGGSLLMAEALVFGRAAHGETMRQGALTDHWRVRRDGRLVLAETVRLDGAVAARMAARAVAGGAIALATVVLAPGSDSDAAAMRTAAESCGGEVGVSAWNGLCVARFCAQDAATLRADLAAVLASLAVPLPRIWLN